jgi:hypothetical protein
VPLYDYINMYRGGMAGRGGVVARAAPDAGAGGLLRVARQGGDEGADVEGADER